jgi:Predicted integral membrane protein (DUF2269)
MLALTWYEWIKAGHVIAAVLWVGGDVMLLILGVRTMATKEPVRIVGFTQQIAWLSSRFFPPLVLILAALGFGLMENGDSPWTYDLTWVQIAIAGWIFAFVVGAFYFSPRLGRLEKLLETRGPEDAEIQAMIQRLIWVGRFDSLVLLFIVFDMTAKPWS